MGVGVPPTPVPVGVPREPVPVGVPYPGNPACCAKAPALQSIAKPPLKGLNFSAGDRSYGGRQRLPTHPDRSR